MSEISKSSKKVSEIINVIDEVAFQTKLLSLNAAVEAARAGEHGRGFSVVASAVGTLAQRSADYAKEIKELISDSSEKVRVGSDLVKKSGEALNEIVVSVKKVSDLISEIAAMSAEQASGAPRRQRRAGASSGMGAARRRPRAAPAAGRRACAQTSHRPALPCGASEPRVSCRPQALAAHSPAGPWRAGLPLHLPLPLSLPFPARRPLLRGTQAHNKHYPGTEYPGTRLEPCIDLHASPEFIFIYPN